MFYDYYFKKLSACYVLLKYFMDMYKKMKIRINPFIFDYWVKKVTNYQKNKIPKIIAHLNAPKCCH